MRKVIASLAAASLLVGGAFVAGLASAPATASAQESDQVPSVDRPHQSRADVLDEILGGLVADGVITQDQADEVRAAFQTKAQELREQRNSFRNGFRRGAKFGFNLRSLLDDGVIDADELAQLPQDHPLLAADGPLAEYLEDGELTAEELREARERHRQQRTQVNGVESGLDA